MTPATLDPPDTAPQAGDAPASDGRRRRPTWEVAAFFPEQGDWSVEEFFDLDLHGNRRVEFVDGFLEFLEMPSIEHQLWAKWLCDRMEAATKRRPIGTALMGPSPVPTIPTRFRDLDVMLVTKRERRGDRTYASKVSVAVEIVSPEEKSRKRDRVTKRREYAAAGIPEYWIVDPDERTVTVLTLPEGASEYAEHGVFAAGETARGLVLDGFAFAVSDLFAAAE